MIPQALIPENVRYAQLVDGNEREDGGKPEEEDPCRFADLVVGQNVSKLLGDVANAFDDGIQALTRVDDD